MVLPGLQRVYQKKCFIWAQVSRKAGLEHQTHSGEHGTVNYLMGMTRTTSFGLNKELIMPGSTVIKWLHRALTVALLVFVVFQYYASQPPDDELYSEQQITSDMYLYITKYKGGGATVSDVYRYYLDAKHQVNPLNHLKKRTPFMVADTGSARITGYGSHVNATITGRIYSFTNSDLFYAGNVAIMPVINLNATGTR
jgi:hypothetical protein